MSDASLNQSIISLCKEAFDEPGGVAPSTSIIKAIANTLLLKEETRQELADSVYPAKIADRLKVGEIICVEEKRGNGKLGRRRRSPE